MAVSPESRAVVQRRRLSSDGLDDFPTPPWATRALIEHVLHAFEGWDGAFAQQRVWEPACGRGHMAAVLMDYFFSVHASDVADYSAEEIRRGRYRGQSRVSDFFSESWMPPSIAVGGVDWIITNPPFNRGADFVLRALKAEPRHGVAMLVRSAFLEGVSRQDRLFDPHPPSLVAQFVERVPMVQGRLDGKVSTATSYCWLVWLCEPPFNGTRLVWIPKCRRRLERVGDYGEVA